jgi:SAM-dependent methyltransferase
MKEDLKTHWENVYAKSEVNNLGWYEKDPVQSFDLICNCKLDKDSIILDVGAGATTLTNKLISDGYTNIILTDISGNALGKLIESIPEEKRGKLTCIVDDITNPRNLPEGIQADLWHDRTVLHFLTEKSQQEGYLKTLKSVVKPGGYVIIAVFSLEGAKKCSGLDVKNYDENMIAEFLGEDFEMIEYFNHIYIQPSGNERPFVYTLFKRIRS